MPLSRRPAILLALAALAGCAQPDPPPPPADPTRPLTFFDSDAFDSQLSVRLGAGATPVTVATAGPVTVNDMPKRLNTWLAAVADHGGAVDVVNSGNVDQDTGRPRFLESIIASLGQSLVMAVIGAVHDKQLYGPVQGYDVILEVAPASGRIDRLYFTRKGG